MLNNVLQFISNSSGDTIDVNLGTVRRLSNLTTTVQVVSPLSSTYSVMGTFILSNGDEITQYMRLSKNNDGVAYKGVDVVDESYLQSHPEVGTYNVWEIELFESTLSSISRFRSGKVGVSFAFREYIPATQGLVLLGTFGSVTSTTGGSLPASSGTQGDYYTCDMLSYLDSTTGSTYTYLEAAYWDGTWWRRGTSFVAIQSTLISYFPVDQALDGQPPQAVDPTFTDQIIDDVATLTSTTSANRVIIDANSDAIGNHTGLINTNTSNIASNLVLIQSNETDIDSHVNNVTDNPHEVKLNEIINPTGDTTFSVGGNEITYNFTNPIGGMTLNMTGGWSGHAFEVHDTSSVPNGSIEDHLAHFESTRLNVIPVHIVQSNLSGAALKVDGNSIFVNDVTINGILNVNGVSGLVLSDIPDLSSIHYTIAGTDALVSTSIADLIDSSPAALDTLNELAAALGDDPNFATTVLNNISTLSDDVTEHKEIQQIRNNFIQSYSRNYKEISYTDGLATSIDIWETVTKTLKLFTKTLTYTDDVITTLSVTDHITGRTLSKEFTYPNENTMTITEVVT